MPRSTEQVDGIDDARPECFAAFLADRGSRKPSAHTLKAYRQDFDAIATLLAGGEGLSGIRDRTRAWTITDGERWSHVVFSTVGAAP